jgi:hypothetical protein
MRSLVDLGSIVMGFDGWKEGRGVDRLGISGMSREALQAFLKTASA